MRKPIQWIAAFFAFCGSASFAQSLPGTWQGTLQAGRELRIVMKVSTTDADGLKAVMYSIDQGSPPIPASSVTLQGSTVKMAIPGIGGSYEGKLAADGKSIVGTWTQGPTPLPLTLTRATDATAWTIPAPPVPLKPMAADANPAFEVATIKPTNPDAKGKGFMVRGRNFATLNTSLGDLITFAYGMHSRQIAGAPAWLDSERYDLSAKPDGEGQPNDKQWKTMVRKLLAERFKLAYHLDKKELSVYAIVPGKTGPKLTKSEGDPNGLPAMGFGALGSLNARNASMADLAGLLQGSVLDRPVVDQSGLAGKFDFALKWTPDEFQFTNMGVKMPPPPVNAESPPDLFTAFQQQLGLKLDATKAAVEILAIDHVEKPSAN